MVKPDVRVLYLRTINDLQKSLSGDQHALVMASGLLRKLLLDGGTSLVDQLNRTHRIKLAFNVFKPTQLPPGLPVPEMHFQSIDPSSVPASFGPTRESVGRDELLRMQFLTLKGHPFSVRELIKISAHVYGGVHLCPPDAHEQLLIDSEDLLFGGSPPSVLSLRGIIRVIVAGLEPLTAAVQAELVAEDVANKGNP